MTRERAALLQTFLEYRSDPTAALTSLVAQKLAYLLQASGESLKLEFTKAKYGPYAEPLNHVLQDMEGQFILGYGDRTTGSDLQLLDRGRAGAHALLAGDAEAGSRIERVTRLIEGFDSPFGLELLTTVHWAAAREGARTPAEALRVLADWSQRKREVFDERAVTIAWERLDDHGWLDPSSS